MTATDQEISPYLRGNFAPVHTEVEAHDLTIVGELPRELDGVYVRNGPNPQFAPLARYHWFDGDGMLHAVRLREGRASYANRWVRTLGWQREHAAGRALWTGLLGPIQLTNPDGPVKNAANTAVVWHDGRLLALWEGGEPHHVRLPGLETVGPYNYGGRLAHAFTAHPKVDARSGELFIFGYNIMGPPYLQYTVAAATGELVHTTPIELPAAVMMHDFAITERHAVFMDLPCTFSLERALRGEPAVAWEPERGARFGVLPRHADGGQIRWFAAEPCYVFHVLNAFEQGDEIVLDACRHARMELGEVRGDSEDTRSDADRPVLHRWRFNLHDGSTREEPLDDQGTEFPRVNDALIGHTARYGYTASLCAESEMADGFVKYDLARGTSERHRHGAGRSGGEGVFVPRPGATAEDDGWLLTYVHDAALDASELVVVAANDLQAPPVARVLLPQRVPWGFHGCWVSAEQFASQRT